MSELPLTPREKQFLRRFAAGKTDRQIALRFGVDAEQISQQRARLLRKLGISTPAEITDAAARLAYQARYRGKT